MRSPRLRTFTFYVIRSMFVFTLMIAISPAGADASPALPSSVTTVGTMRVEAYGSGSPAIIFIPGLACGSWIWDDAVREYSGDHAVYTVTLPGFDGLAAVPGNALDNASASLLKLVSTPGMNRPILVGHSLGAFLAIRFGMEHAELVRGIVAVDGTPVFPSLSDATAEQRVADAAATTAELDDQTHEQFETGQRKLLAGLMNGFAAANKVAELSAKSDPKATAEYAREFLSADLRPRLKNLTVATLEIAPVPNAPTTYEGPQAASASMEARSAFYVRASSALFAGAPNFRVVTVKHSNLFVMVDQPRALLDAISSFLATLPNK